MGGDGLRKLVRLQFALMPPGSVIHVHRDMGGYAQKAHRIHVPIVTDPDVLFEVRGGLIPFAVQNHHSAPGCGVVLCWWPVPDTHHSIAYTPLHAVQACLKKELH